jgi:hypothetical protein
VGGHLLDDFKDSSIAWTTTDGHDQPVGRQGCFDGRMVAERMAEADQLGRLSIERQANGSDGSRASRDREFYLIAMPGTSARRPSRVVPSLLKGSELHT